MEILKFNYAHHCALNQIIIRISNIITDEFDFADCKMLTKK